MTCWRRSRAGSSTRSRASTASRSISARSRLPRSSGSEATLRAVVARIVLLGLLTFAVLVPPASASEHLGDRDVSYLSLKVNGRGEALVSYRTPGGARRDVLIWGAVNAHPPDP